MMESTTVYLFDELLEIEDKNKLFDYQIDGLRIWQYVRFVISAKLLEELTGIRTTSAGSKRIHEKKTTNWIKRLKRNQFLAHHKEVLFITYSRRTLENGKYRNPITEELTESLSMDYYVYESAYMGGHCEPAQTRNLKYINPKFLHYLFKYDGAVYEKKVKELVDFLYKIFSEKYELKSGFRQFMHSYITTRLEQIYYNKLYARFVLRLVSPRIIILYGAYLEGMQEMVCVAKKRGIPVIELQHGRIGATHGGYNYKSLHELETFPDYLFVYGEYEKGNVRYPIMKERIIPVGAPELERKARLYNSRNKFNSRKKILFTPGAMENDIVLKYAVELERKLDQRKFEIIYKLHPADYADWKRKYPQLKQCLFKVIDNNKHDIYYYLGIADYVVGISSTSLFEAMMFKAQILIIKALDYVKVEAVYNNCGKLISSVDELVDVVQSGKKVRENYNYEFYYSKDAVENMQTAIRTIINK